MFDRIKKTILKDRNMLIMGITNGVLLALVCFLLIWCSFLQLQNRKTRTYVKTSIRSSGEDDDGVSKESLQSRIKELEEIIEGYKKILDEDYEHKEGEK